LYIKPPKYSIIIPTYNVETYLPTCIETIISQGYSDYELIISDDHSTDGTHTFLETLEHPNISIVYPPELLSMTEHWEWALFHAKGEWQIFVGQDDGVQPYFFKLADKLTNEAKEKGLRTIMSSRAYFFWQGCEYVYGDIAVGYCAENKTRVHNFKYQALKALLGLQDYFELPQMYTTALFHKDLLDEARSKQDGKVFLCHPQDANLAAIACSLEKQYLKSYIPFGWVGSSPKSAGMAISGARSSLSDKCVLEESEQLKKDYLKKISKSKLKYHEWAGDFSFGSIALYFWQALLMTQHLRTEKENRKIKSRPFKIILFARILYAKKFPKIKSKKALFKIEPFNELLQINHCNQYSVFTLFILIVVLAKPLDILSRVMRKIGQTLSGDRVMLRINWADDTQAGMIKASKQIANELDKKEWF
jgi:glycosyltransferase involved in cell wall biosynthesis